MLKTTIDPEMKMEEILERIPSAQRALFRRYHVGGCSACGFQPTDTLAQVCKDHNILDVQEVVQHLLRSHELDQNMQVDPETVRGWLAEGTEFRFVDVRMATDGGEDPIPEAELLDRKNSQKYMDLPHETKFVFACANGESSLDVAAYFSGHGFREVYALRGGARAWNSAG